MEKRCSKCGQIKDVSEFYVYGSSSKRPGQVYSRCKQCECSKARTYHTEHAEHCNARKRRWIQNNEAYVKRKKSDYYRENKERLVEKQHIYNQVHRREQVAYALRWSKEHPYQRRVARLAWRLRQSVFDQPIDANKLVGRIEFYGWSCRYCGQPLSLKTLTIDHRIPVSRGGRNHPANLVPSCRRCNSRKREMTEREYLEHVQAHVALPNNTKLAARYRQPDAS